MTRAEEVIDALRDVAFTCGCGVEHLTVNVPDRSMCCSCGATWVPVRCIADTYTTWYRGLDRRLLFAHCAKSATR